MNIYADETAVTFVLAGYGMMPDQKCLYDERNRCVNSYIYFRYPNIIYGVLSKRDSDMYGHENISELLPIINQKHIIYSNGYNAIYT